MRARTPAADPHGRRACYARSGQSDPEGSLTLGRQLAGAGPAWMLRIEDGRVASCEAMSEQACPNPELPLGEFCPALCSGALAVIDSAASPEDATACVEDIEACEGDGFTQIFICSIETPEFCEDICDAMSQCEFADDSCESTCSMGAFGTAADAPIPACIAAAEDDCGAIGLCLNAAEGP